ncbi:GNAT family N-acetyltransferase [Endozoicomonas sp. G2_1]|uniref:GNAT family N-acetyltransferase n=1 Tax=Endozoicomonas sp. G2_1 TaxID=2821091 RepID=UPI001ADD476A|nr:GNAT family N-acetyltransferase [Endozoicomonas sp. G2_1]MBO9489481.1 GNAT family N-acetyltransferase [Endozoicomonas sp. G2_1]
MTKNISYRPLQQQDFDAVIELANRVHGQGYLNQARLQAWYQQGFAKGINSHFVAYDQGLESTTLAGFRLCFATEQWRIDQWCSPELWSHATEQVAYFKCNTVDENYRGLGVGSQLLKLSVAALKQQGATAGVSHLWRQSPGNSAIKYFSKCGGKLIKDHPRKWQQDCDNGYECIICGFECYCVAAEMMITFDTE